MKAHGIKLVVYAVLQFKRKEHVASQVRHMIIC